MKLTLKHAFGPLLVTAVMAGGMGTPSLAQKAPVTTAAKNPVSGEWTGKLDWIDVRSTLTLQGNKVTGTFYFGDRPHPIEAGVWDVKTGQLSFRWMNGSRPVTVKGILKNGTFTGTATISGGTDPLVMKRAAPAPTTAAPAQVTPYVMQGVVRDAAGRPLAGVEVFADNTLYYNANALARTDAQGRYRLELPRNEPGIWKPGAYVKREYHGVFYELRLYPGDDSPFAASKGAVRDFVWRLSGRQEDGLLGKVVYVYGEEGVNVANVEVTLTPSGPLIDGSAGRAITRRVTGGRIEDVPIGRYTMTARLVRDGAAPVPLLVSPGQGGGYGASATSDFQKTNYGVIMEFTVKLGAAPAPAAVGNSGGTAGRSISGVLQSSADLQGTAVILCEVRNGECDESTERQTKITTSGTSARYSFSNVTAGKSYFIYGWKDTDGNGRANSGDLVGMFGAQYGVSSEPQAVTAPSMTADFDVTVLN
jgi:hypothetical protein